MSGKRGRLVLIEGLDRAGKSTQAAYLESYFPNSRLVKFPDRTTTIGKIINNYLTDESFTLSDQSAHLLFSSNRWELANGIIEDLHSGKFVVMDRYIYSGIAYSLAKSRVSASSSPEMGNIAWLYSPDRGLPQPDITLFLTIDLEELSHRKGWGEERYEKEEFQKQVKQCFSKAFTADEEALIEVVDVNNKSIAEVSEKIVQIIKNHDIDTLTDKPIKVYK